MTTWLKSARDAAVTIAGGIGTAVLAAVAMVDDWREERR